MRWDNLNKEISQPINVLFLTRDNGRIAASSLISGQRTFTVWELLQLRQNAKNTIANLEEALCNVDALLEEHLS
jgi:hypothetical protein